MEVPTKVFVFSLLLLLFYVKAYVICAPVPAKRSVILTLVPLRVSHLPWAVRYENLGTKLGSFPFSANQRSISLVSLFFRDEDKIGEATENQVTEHAHSHHFNHTEGKCEFCDYLRVKRLLEHLNK